MQLHSKSLQNMVTAHLIDKKDTMMKRSMAT